MNENNNQMKNKLDKRLIKISFSEVNERCKEISDCLKENNLTDGFSPVDALAFMNLSCFIFVQSGVAIEDIMNCVDQSMDFHISMFKKQHGLLDHPSEQKRIDGYT